MPIGTPFHKRTSELCTSLFFTDWAGYHTVSSYDTCHEREYYALRNAAGLIDVSPLFKYEVRGKDAADFLARVMVKDITKLEVGRCAYTCWCDDHGKVLDDGTVFRLADTHFRVAAAEPSFAWLMRQSRRFEVTIEDSSDRIGTLSWLAPTSLFPGRVLRAILVTKSGSSVNRRSRSTMPSCLADATTEFNRLALMPWTSRVSKPVTS